MRSITVILCALVALCSGHYMTKQVRYADKDFLIKQKFVFDVLQHVHQDDVYGHKYDEYKTYKIYEHLQNYNEPEKIQQFVDHCLHHPFPAEEIFTILDEDHVEYGLGLARVFYFAKDFDTFTKTVMWARLNVNKQLFIYAFQVATLARPDMQGIVYPAIYEIYPYYFFNSATIQKAQHVKMQGFQGLKKIEDVWTVAITSNYTGKYGHINEDNLLSYYTEDVGLNAFYYYYNLDYPYWTQGSKDHPLRKDERGAFYLYLHWQLLARYNMERLSHDLDEFSEFNWYGTMYPGYHADLRYYNGLHFPNRDNKYNFYNHDNYYLIDVAQFYEDRIMESIDLGRFILPDLTHIKFDEKKIDEFVDILGNVIQGNADSVNKKYYGSLDRQLRYIINEGIPYGKHEEVLPGALMHYETSQRDPAFYEMYKRIMRYVWRVYEHIPPYTEQQLGFEGVTIEGVEVDKLVTYFDKFDSDITNAVDVEPYNEAVATDLVKFGRFSQYQGQSFVIKARQYRLNHLPFTVKTTINSNKAQKAAIKYFIGPKYDSYGHKIHLKENIQNFLELEHFVVDLVPGKNVITRSSDDFTWFVQDRTTYFELYKKLMMATNSENYKFPLDMSEAHCGFPNRLMLPRGKKGGMPFQIFAYVLPYQAPEVPQFTGYDPIVSCGVGSGAKYVDNTPFGYPFDRKIDPHYWPLDNMRFQDVLVYHKTEAEVNAIHH